MIKDATPQIEIDNAFAGIVERYNDTNTNRALGEAALDPVEPFGHQFMSDIPDTQLDPKATGRGGKTACIVAGMAKSDDVSQNDVM